MSGPLGFIPAFQFSANPNVNPYVNPHATMPQGMYQAGVYTTQPQLNGNLGGVHARPLHCLNCAIDRPSQTAMGYVMIDEPDGMPIVGPPPLKALGSFDNPFATWWWNNRKTLLVVGAATVGLVALSTMATLFR